MSMRFISIALFFSIYLTGNIIMLNAQNAPVTTAAIAESVTPGSISIPVTVTGFNNIGAISLTLDYDYSVLHFTGSTPNPQLSSFVAGDMNLGTGFHRISMGWFGSGKTLSDGSTIITLHFTYIEGNTILAWYDNGPSCEYADGNINVLNDIPTETYYINGQVCGVLDAPGAITGDTIVCAGQQGAVYSVAPVANATGYEWDLQDGAVIVSGENTNAIQVDFGIGSVSGDISVYATNECSQGPASVQTVVVNSLPLAFAGNDTTINYGTSTNLHAAVGGNEVYSYHWSPEELLVDPDVQDPETLILTETTIFTVFVTNQATYCQNSDQVTVSITGGPLSANPVAFPESICAGESAQLYSNAGGGSGNYTYLWTSIPAGNPPWSSTEANPVISPDSSRFYFLEVYDGFTSVDDSTPFIVHPLPTAFISGGDTLCGENVYDTLRVDLTGVAPWNFSYTYGNTTVYIINQEVSPYYIIASDPGDYTLNDIYDAHCEGIPSGAAIVRKYPVPETPEITVNSLELISSSCCGNQWYRNGSPIPGANAQTYHVTESGEYTVVVTLNTCSSSPSAMVDIIVGVPEHDACLFSIYPNPSSGQINFSSDCDFISGFQVMLLTSSGTMIKKQAYEGNQGMFVIDAAGLPAGLYFAVMETDGFKYAEKIMIY